MQKNARRPSIDWFKVFGLIILPIILWTAIVMVTAQLMYL